MSKRHPLAGLIGCLLVTGPALADSGPTVGQPLPRVAALTLDGGALSSETLLAEAGTRALLVQLWATWCGPCIEELEQLERGAAALEDAGITVMLVNVMEPVGTVAAFMTAHPQLSDFPLVRDATGAVVEALQPASTTEDAQGGSQRTGSLPYAALAGQDGTILKVYTSPRKLHVRRMIFELKRAQ